MLQLIGRLCVFLGVSMIGLLLRRGLYRRVSCLRELLRGLECVERELAFALPPVEALLERLAQETRGECRAVYLSCRERFIFRGEERLEEIWTACFEAAELPLEEEDLNLIREVGGILGRYDGESQRLALRSIQSRLGGQITAAREEAGRMGKVYGTLGVSLGLLTVILL